jgi:cell division protein FtsB
MTITAPTPAPNKTKPKPAPPPELEPRHGTETERPSGRPRTAAAQRAYARRAHREGRKPERASRAEREETAASRASFVVLIIVLLVVGVASTLWLSTQAIADSYRLEDAKQAANDLSERAEVLQREVTKMDSPSALAQRAKELGMVLPGDPARLVVQPDGSVVVVGEPKPAPAPAPPVPAPPADGAQPPPADAAQPPPADGAQPPPAQDAPAQRAG